MMNDDGYTRTTLVYPADLDGGGDMDVYCIPVLALSCGQRRNPRHFGHQQGAFIIETSKDDLSWRTGGIVLANFGASFAPAYWLAFRSMGHWCLLNHALSATFS